MNKKLSFLVIAAGLVISGCGTTRIGRVLSDPMRYQNRNVAVEGTVTSSVGAFVAGLYQVDDGTGKIYVVSNRGVPQKGARVKVSGNVTPGLSFMGKSWGTAIRERDHKVRY